MSQFLNNRLARLETHLKGENPSLLSVLPTYYKFDKLLYRMGLQDRENSLAARISWWPLISVLGTFSSGKSTFINDYIGDDIQLTGNQAVDDKFTVICQGSGGQSHNLTLPGTALDADPRFPFFRISREIEKVAHGEGKHIESYLQLRTTSSPRIKNKIIIDSPGFDADDQRTSTLRITDHIIDLSDLVLVFFDARHPEPGAMQDTLDHLVRRTARRTDSSKFLYVLNQIDTAASEDNPEDVVAAWQRAVAQAGLSAGRFYTIYSENHAVEIKDMSTKQRFQTKRDEDLAKILDRMDEVEMQRNYRIVSVLETVANELEHDLIPQLTDARNRWKKRVLTSWAVLVGLAVALAATFAITTGWRPNMSVFSTEWIMTHRLESIATLVAVILLGGALHFWLRSVFARRVARKLDEKAGQAELNVRAAFLKGTGWWHSLLRAEPAGWGRRAATSLRQVRDAVASHIQTLNDKYADPSGRKYLEGPASPAEAQN